MKHGDDFEGLRAVVTGGAGGIGRATAELLTSRGARVAVLDLQIDDVPQSLLPLRADMGDRESVNAAIAAAGDALGGLDILINNVGIGAQGTIADNDDAEWARVLDINVTSIARATTAALPLLRVRFSWLFIGERWVQLSRPL